MSYGYRRYGYVTKQDTEAIRAACERRHEFHNSTRSFRGEHVTDWSRRWLSRQLGRLPEPWRTDLNERRVDYVVRSYETVIAYHGTRGWTVPTVTYNPTTSNHQRQLRRALGIQPDDAWPDGQEPLWPVVMARGA